MSEFQRTNEDEPDERFCEKCGSRLPILEGDEQDDFGPCEECPEEAPPQPKGNP